MSTRAVTECPPGQRFRPNGKARRAAVQKTPEAPRPEVSEAPFAQIPAEPIDAPMWPIHPGVWFQPERTPSFQTCTLDIERQHRLPVGDFVRSGALQPVDTGDAREWAGEPQAPRDRAGIPESGLSLLGWDPRTVCRKERSE